LTRENISRQDTKNAKETRIVKGGNHVANSRRYLLQTQTADWMAQHLGVPKC